MRARQLSWDGCTDVRDLGGLATACGGRTRWGAVVRADHPSKLKGPGWRALVEHGVRTIIELRTHGVDQRFTDAAPRPMGLQCLALEIEDFTDPTFAARWVETRLWGTPLYYRDALQRWPGRHAAVIAAFADAAPGGVLVHCARGQDRTGIISLLLLALAGVDREDIIADYALSDGNMPPAEQRALRDALAREGATLRRGLDEALDALEVVDSLREGGLDAATITRARARLVEPARAAAPA